ncbi:MAG: glutamine-hydrolyzing carbamoyl-phosphate synthase small subunit [Bacteroidales bacterium]|nr:glutamine-hydrolyzing carbamoyl-phosphate synthase small subunit [Bacteroidales bacterium]
MEQEKKKAKLMLKDGLHFEGYAFGHLSSKSGEIVFNTAMTGYPESLTDPSYKGQILVATYPLIGNYGIPGNSEKNKLYEYYESDAIQISGLVISEYSEKYSHWNAELSLDEWMKNNKVPGIYGIDTAALTKHLRENGAMSAKIVIDEDIPFYDPSNDNLVAQVSISQKTTYGDGQYKVLLIDCGVKNNIIRHLIDRNCTVIRVPWDYNFDNEEYDGLFISNGPGDPTHCKATIDNLSKAFDKNDPIFGICLGNQLMSLAAGASTYKLKYGHRSHNQPVLDLRTQRAYITSQNHGYAVDSKSLPDDWSVNFVNLNDRTNEGFYHNNKPFFSTQFHPEASGGPTDTEFLFDEFIDLIKKAKQSENIK